MTSGQTTRVILLLLATSLMAAPAVAQIYKYKDASGRMIISDKPPPGKSVPPATGNAPSVEAETKPAPTATPQGKPGVDPKLEARRQEQEAKAKAEQDEKNRAIQEEMKAACAESRGYLAALEDGQRIARRTASGEREYLSDEQRAAEIERVKKRLAQCN